MTEVERLTHLDPDSGPHMVNVGEKDVTRREAVARGRVLMQPDTLLAVRESRTPKGDVLSVAQLAGIMAAKETSRLIPLTHNIPLSHIGVDLWLDEEHATVGIQATVRTIGQTGAEMEALTAVSMAALTVYDMCKGLDKDMRIQDLRLVRKTGGKSGDVHQEN